MVDERSSVDILYWATYQKFQILVEAMVPYDEPIYRFYGERVCAHGYIDLQTLIREGSQTKIILIRFLVVDAHTSYNVLLGRTLLNTLGAIVSTPHLALKFLSSSGDIIIIHDDLRFSHECCITSLRPKELTQITNNIERHLGTGLTLTGEDLDPRICCDSRIEQVEDTKPMTISLGKSLQLGVGLSHNDQDLIEMTLQDNTDLFTWLAVDLPNVDPQIVVRKLSIYREARYVSQKKRKLGDKQRLVAKAEAIKLFEVRFIVEAHYTTWIVNIVLVKKSSDRWRMCVDNTDLNKTCPKDAYPLPSIDRLIHDAASNRVLSFLDAYFVYNKIPSVPANMIKIAFITEDSNYFYKVMPFDLKNVGATYQRLMDKVFNHLFEKCVEVYVDDMVVKSPSHLQHLKDLAKVFATFQK